MRQENPPPLVLFADDYPEVRDLGKMVLNDEGYNVVLAKDGKEAWDLLVARRPALAILDNSMPYHSGVEVRQRQLQNLDPGIKNIPVVLCTGGRFSDRPDVPFDGFLAKPFDLKDLLKIVNTLTRSLHFLT